MTKRTASKHLSELDSRDPILAGMVRDGIPLTSPRRHPRARRCGDALNARGIKTARGRQWAPATVRNVLLRQTRADTVSDRAA